MQLVKGNRLSQRKGGPVHDKAMLLGDKGPV